MGHRGLTHAPCGTMAPQKSRKGPADYQAERDCGTTTP